MRDSLGLILVGAAITFVPGPLAAQNDCGVDHADIWRAVAQGSPSETHFFTRVTVSCADGTDIYADSAIVSPTQSLSQFFGNVSFNEEGRELLADRATYRSDIDRLDAFGNVSLIDTTGSELEGDNLVYIRDADNQQDAHLTMTGSGGTQPRALIVPGASSAPDSVAADSVIADTAQAGAAADSLLADSLLADSLAVDSIPPDSTVPDSVVTEPAALDTVPPEPVVPYEVTADRIIIEGGDRFRGEGNVEVTREALHATGDNMVYESGRGELLMAGDARSEGEGYDLTAESITVVLPDDKVEAIVARRDAVLATDDLDLTAPKIQIFVDSEKLERLVAAQLGPDDGPTLVGQAATEGDTRATALTQDFLLFGDSLEVVTPNEELERVTAVGRARGEAFGADTAAQFETLELAQNDWLEGDTIVATFVPNAPDTAPTAPLDTVRALADSADALAGFQAVSGEATTQPAPARERYSLDRLVAAGSARSLYRMAPSDTTGTVEPGRIALHYVVGDGITILMVDGEVDRMEVSGQTQGFHLEPVAFTQVADSLSADSTAVDSLSVDTLAVDTISTAPVGVDTVAVPPDRLVHLPMGQSAHSGVRGRLTLWTEPARGLAELAPYRPSRRTLWPTH